MGSAARSSIKRMEEGKGGGGGGKGGGGGGKRGEGGGKGGGGWGKRMNENSFLKRLIIKLSRNVIFEN